LLYCEQVTKLELKKWTKQILEKILS